MPRTKKTAVEPIAEAVSEKPAVEAEAAVVAAPEEKKEEPKKTTRKKTVKEAETEAAPKRCVRKKAAVETEEEEPKAAAVETAVEKTEEQVSIKVQFGGKDISMDEILEKAKAAFAAANEGVEIRTVELYVNADDHAAYYVINGQVPENNKIAL